MSAPTTASYSSGWSSSAARSRAVSSSAAPGWTTTPPHTPRSLHQQQSMTLLDPLHAGLNQRRAVVLPQKKTHTLVQERGDLGRGPGAQERDCWWRKTRLGRRRGLVGETRRRLVRPHRSDLAAPNPVEHGWGLCRYTNGGLKLAWSGPSAPSDFVVGAFDGPSGRPCRCSASAAPTSNRGGDGRGREMRETEK
jgi:hypothetical protein